jgi:hypothetical protein
MATGCSVRGSGWKTVRGNVWWWWDKECSSPAPERFSPLPSRRSEIGFRKVAAAQWSRLDFNQLSAALPRELINRFRNPPIQLGPLTFTNYLEMLADTVERLPEPLQELVLLKGYRSARNACALRLGTRWLEELVTPALLDLARGE